MNNHKLDKYFVRFRHLPIWATFVISGSLFVVSGIALRVNNQNMIQLRQAVFDADEQGGDVNKALNELRAYVYAHMNTELAPGDNAIKPPIQLKYTYERLVQQELAKQDGGSGDVYAEAQVYCEQTQPSGFYGRTRLDCIRQYIDQHGDVDVVESVNIPEDLYKFDFASPKWSPDSAGWSLVMAFVALIISVTRLAVDRSVRSAIRKLQ
ncbi:hypothetical protein KC867_01400 [Candidatus Saccharibacteria bacterium]|nr:hypothetical protein [Candidatus Saccharibacteria bacterium]